MEQKMKQALMTKNKVVIKKTDDVNKDFIIQTLSKEEDVLYLSLSEFQDTRDTTRALIDCVAKNSQVIVLDEIIKARLSVLDSLFIFEGNHPEVKVVYLLEENEPVMITPAHAAIKQWIENQAVSVLDLTKNK